MKKITLFLTLALAILSTGCTRIDTGNIGVERTMGQIKADELTPGVYFTLFKSVDEISGKETALSMSDLKPKAKENLTMQDFDFDVYYRVNPTLAADLIAKYSGDSAASNADDGSVNVGINLLTRHAREAAYNAVAKREFAQIQNLRADISSDIEKNLQRELDEKTIKGAFVITNVVIRNITTDANLEKSIREAADVEFQVRKKTEQMKLAEVEAERLRIEAQGQATANKLISESITPQLVQLRQVEAMEKFSSNKSATILLGTGATPLIQAK